MTTGPIQELALLLDQEGIAYALIGGHAVNLYIEPRLTRDIDVTIAAGTDYVERIDAALSATSFELVRKVGHDLPSGPDFLRYLRDQVVVEIQTAKTEFQEQVIERATNVDGVRVATPEDLIILKLIAYRPKDMDDLRGLRDLPSINWAYVQRWADEWDIADRLTQLRCNEP